MLFNILNPNKTGLCAGTFFWEGQFDHILHISRKINPISIYVCTSVKCCSRLKEKKCWDHLFYADAISFFIARKCQKIRKIDENSLIINIEEQNLHIFWTT